MARCDITHYTVQDGPPYYANGPMRAVAMCRTHQFQNLPPVSTQTGTEFLCPIGRIEQARWRKA